MGSLRILAERIGQFLNSERAAGAVEFAIVSPVLVLMAVGTSDLGMSIYVKMEVQNAVQAGAQYAVVHGYDATGIAAAVAAASPVSVSISAGPTEYCGCVTSSGIAVVSCTSTCQTGDIKGTYVSLSGSKSYDTILHYPGLPAHFDFVSSVNVRIQ